MAIKTKNPQVALLEGFGAQGATTISDDRQRSILYNISFGEDIIKDSDLHV